MRLRGALLFVGLVVLVCGAVGLEAGVPIPDFRSADSTQKTVFADPCPASEFPPIEIAFASLISETLPDTKTNIRCITEVRSKGEPVRGVPIMLGGDLIDGDGNAVASLPTRSGSTNKAGQKAFTFPYSVPPPGSDLGVIMEGLLEGDLEIDFVDTTCGIIQRTPCARSDTTACLEKKKRFMVEVESKSSSGTTKGMVSKSSKTAAFFYFFSSSSTDLLVEVMKNCSKNDHFWVFASSSTSVPFDLTVTDTLSGESRAYTNPGALEPILDTSAFATCP